MQPDRLGADIVVHSATKYLGGHGTTLAGIVVESGKFPWDNGKFPGMTEPSPGYHGVKFYETFGDFGFTMRCRMETLRVYGAALSPMSAWQILQGVETLPLRMERHCSNALAVARVPARSTSGELGQLSRARRPSAARADEAADAWRLGPAGLRRQGRGRARREVHRERAVHEPPGQHRRHAHADQPPGSTTHRQLDDAQQLAAGVLPDMVRISVGLEHIDDILWDIDQALAKASA